MTMQKILQLHLEELNNFAQLGLYSNKRAADLAIEAICESNQSHRFTMGELRELLWDFSYLAAGLEELIRNNFR